MRIHFLRGIPQQCFIHLNATMLDAVIQLLSGEQKQRTRLLGPGHRIRSIWRLGLSTTKMLREWDECADQREGERYEEEFSTTYTYLF